MRQAGSLELYSYWDALRRGRAAPERSDLDPIAMRNFLADTFMLEVDRFRGYPSCLSGTKLNALFDLEVRGLPFLSLWNEAQKRDVLSMLEVVTDGPCPVIAGVSAAPENYDKTGFELLLLPLRYYGKTHARILGRIAAAQRPSWLGLIPIQALNLQSMRILEPSSSSVTIHAAQGEFAKPLFPNFERRGHLRVYDANS